VVWILKSLSKCKQFNDSGFGSSYFWEKIDFVFFDLIVLVTLPDLFILDKPLFFDFIEMGPFLSTVFLVFYLNEDFADLDT